MSHEGAGAPATGTGEHTMQTTSNPTGTTFWFDSQIFEVLVSSHDTGGTLSMLRQTLAPGYAPPTHVHEREDQTLYVLDGSITAWIDPHGEDRTVVSLGAGDEVHLPRGVPHAFKAGADGARLLEINTPGGFEDFHLEVGEEPTHDGMPEQRPPDVERMVRCSGDYGCTILGPPPE